MKNYNEMANDVLRRIGEHETEQRNRRKNMKKVILPICCFCLVAILGIGLWQGDFFGNTPATKLEDSTIIGEKDNSDNTNSDFVNSSPNANVIGMLNVNGVNYVQCSTTTKLYTPDKYLGEASDFGGTFQISQSDVVVGDVYLAKEDSDFLVVEVKNGEYTDYLIMMKDENQDNSKD